MRRIPITAHSNGYSLWSRDVESGILPTVRELGSASRLFAAWSRIPDRRDQVTERLPEDDYRRFHPRFTGENFERNIELVGRSARLRTRRVARPLSSRSPGCLARGQDIVPIPGTKRRTLPAAISER
jgi:aryl-alcohol dehydrogenase-like predicted oxidoreductase